MRKRNIFFLVLILLAAAIGAWVWYANVQGTRQVALTIELASGIDRIELYDARSTDTPIAIIYPVTDGRRLEARLPVYQGVEYRHNLTSIFYYFIIYKGEDLTNAFKSESFTLEKYSDSAKLNVAESGHWTITRP